MTKLYLIRKNLETFVGPWSTAEIKDAVKTMQFGLQDEVSGHLGPWVTMDQRERMKKYYPDLAKALYEGNGLDWGLGDTDIRSSDADTQRLRAQGQRNLTWAVLFFVGAAIAFGIAVYLANAAKMAAKAREEKELSFDTREAERLAQVEGEVALDRYLARHSSEIANAMAFQGKEESDWLPYVRSFALRGEGSFAGVSAKVLRGQTSIPAPVDCSEKAWEQRWRQGQSQWSRFAAGEELIRSHWARILAWDPHWISRELASTNHAGWRKGETYFTLCLTMAKKGLEHVGVSQMGSQNKQDLVAKARFLRRIDWMISVLSLNPTEGFKFSREDSFLEGLTCVDSAKTLTELSACQKISESTYFRERFARRLSWFVAQDQSLVGKPEFKNQFKIAVANLSMDDYLTQFRYPFVAQVGDLVRDGMLSAGKKSGNSGQTPASKASH